jgi:hypothetical protein
VELPLLNPQPAAPRFFLGSSLALLPGGCPAAAPHIGRHTTRHGEAMLQAVVVGVETPLRPMVVEPPREPRGQRLVDKLPEEEVRGFTAVEAGRRGAARRVRRCWIPSPAIRPRPPATSSRRCKSTELL